ncbi:MAG TPA: choice-of-anchor Q domain-containing protein, partial [bacterium]|nr:choice-of-anchor Q domain-containing protein [bacterium]
MKKLFVFLLFITAVSSINAATRTVCAVGCDYTSVKTAVNAAVADDIIDVHAGTYQDYNIVIAKNLTIQGAGMHDTIIQAASKEGSASYRVFKITDGTVTFKNMTIRYGYSSIDGNYGGGISFAGTSLTVDNCYINANKGYYGAGGLYITAGTVDINRSVILGNKGNSDYGGGIYAYNSTVTVTESTISGNSAGYGGGIYTTNATMIFDRSVISGNTASSYGGGIYNYNNSSISMKNTTISNNFAYAEDGGGILNSGGCYIKIDNGTIAGNFSMDQGGGIYNSSSARVEMRNTIIADNMANSTPNDCFGVLDSYGYNLIENLSFCAIGTDNSHNVLGRDPKLEPLSTNGGSTATHAIIYDSPALDAGVCTDMAGNTVATDQRNIARPHGTTCDIGAYEYNGEIPVTKYACWDNNEDDICQPETEDFNGDGDCTPQDCKGEDGLSCWDLDGDRTCNVATEDFNGDSACTITDCRGTPGPNGYACWDLIANHTCDAGTEDTNGDGFCNIQDCQGTAGSDGADGYNCWDLDTDYICDPVEDKNADGDCTVADCQGVQGATGAAGVSCWDINANGSCDAMTEDQNKDTQCNILDCRGATGATGSDGADGTDGFSCWDGNTNHIC